MARRAAPPVRRRLPDLMAMADANPGRVPGCLGAASGGPVPDCPPPAMVPAAGEPFVALRGAVGDLLAREEFLARAELRAFGVPVVPTAGRPDWWDWQSVQMRALREAAEGLGWVKCAR